MSDHFGLYIHIPFCKSKCAYCDFYSVTCFSQKEALLHCLLAELSTEQEYIGLKHISTVYMGGGTPSLLTAQDYAEIFEEIGRHYDLTRCSEVSLEANPEDLNPAYLASLRSLPFNRISLGIQSLQNTELKAIGRRHTAAQAIDAVRHCQEAGFTNISIDLMFGLPLQNEVSLQNTIEQALELDAPHISAYMLSLEPGTRLYKDKQQGRYNELSDEEAEKMFFQLADQLIKAGYEHYELSNFARPGFRAVHNASYWSGQAYLGLGPAAHSYNGKTRRWNPASIQAYIRGIQRGQLSREEESLGLETQYNELILTSLRTCEGFKLEELNSLFGPSYVDYCIKQAHPLLEAGLLENKEGCLRLSRSAYFVSDSVIRTLFLDEDEPFKRR